jgi:hypothetical protein
MLLDDVMDVTMLRPSAASSAASSLGSKFRKNSGRNSGSGPFSGIFGSGVAGIIFLGIAFFRTF